MFSRLLTALIIFVAPGCLSITCTYSRNGENYLCQLINQMVENENDLSIVDGQHSFGYGNENVTDVISNNSVIRIFPSLLIDAFENLKTLSMTSVMMTSFASPITKCDHLESIILDENELSDIPGRIFEKCGQVNVINLKNNNIGNVNEYAFAGLEALLRLDLQRNSIETLNDTVLHPLRSLNVINLSNNKMQNMAMLPLLFEVSINLEYIWIDDNNFTDLPPVFFANCANLQAISVIGNQMTNIGAALLRNVGNLVEFESGYNRIEEIPTFEGIEKLVRLDLNNNQIRKIDAASFGNLPNILLIRLSNNYIETIEVGSFRNMARLRHLSIDNNNLTYLEPDTFALLISLDYLDLSNNYLTHLSGVSLNGLLVLTRLNINSNRIETVDKDILEKLPELQLLYMLNNICTNSTHNIYYYEERVIVSPSLDQCSDAIINKPSFVVAFIAFYVSLFKW